MQVVPKKPAWVHALPKRPAWGTRGQALKQEGVKPCARWIIDNGPLQAVKVALGVIEEEKKHLHGGLFET